MLKDLKQKVKFGIICGVFIISISFSCKTQKPKRYVEFSTSACYGYCPILDAKVENDKVYFNFIDYNKLKGIYMYNLKEKEIKKIDSLINIIDLKNIKNEYISNREDMQAINVIVKTKIEQKSIYYYVGDEPKELNELVETILKFKNNKLIKIDTVIKFSTRKEVEIIKKPIPPMPNFN